MSKHHPVTKPIESPPAPGLHKHSLCQHTATCLFRYLQKINAFFSEKTGNRRIFHTHKKFRQMNNKPTRSDYKKDLEKMKRHINGILKKYNVEVNSANIQKLEALPLYGQREMVRDVLIFLSYDQYMIFLPTRPFRFLWTKRSVKLKVYDPPATVIKIWNRYRGDMPILEEHTIRCYLPDILMLLGSNCP
jgi:hypothetical protein